MSVERFIAAQASAETGFETALAELRAGRKTSHWIWYIFPQLAGLGHSSTAQFYGVKDSAEAAEFLRHPGLRANLLTLLTVVAEKLAGGTPLPDLMGGTTDSQKLVSSLTLFEHVASLLNEGESSRDFASVRERCAEILKMLEPQGYRRCPVTLARIGSSPGVSSQERNGSRRG